MITYNSSAYIDGNVYIYFWEEDTVLAPRK